jgi:hypothetical protein
MTELHTFWSAPIGDVYRIANFDDKRVYLNKKFFFSNHIRSSNRKSLFFEFSRATSYAKNNAGNKVARFS